MSLFSDAVRFFRGAPPARVTAELMDSEGLTYPDPPRIPRIQASADSAGGGYLVPAGTTIGSILDHQFGLGLPPIFAVGSQTVMSRELAATYAAVYRCVSLMSGVIAGLLTTGLRIIDSDTRRSVTTPDARALIRLLQEMPNLETPAYEWWEDFTTDYFLDGNALAAIYRSGSRVEALRLLRPWDAYAGETAYGPVYTAHPDDERGAQIKLSFRDVLHARWARLSSRGAVRRHFALAPISVLSRAISLGIESDSYVSDYFSGRDGGAKGKVVISYPDVIQDEQRDQIIESLGKYAQGRQPLVLMGDAKITQIKDSPQDADALKLRQFQVAEIGRVFGVPAPLLGVEVTEWGSGIEQLARLLYRFGARQHLMRTLSPLSVRLLPPGQMFVVDETELLRGDTAALADLISRMVGSPNGPAVLSIEEARHLLGFPIDDLPDQPIMPTSSPPSEPEPAADDV